MAILNTITEKQKQSYANYINREEQKIKEQNWNKTKTTGF